MVVVGGAGGGGLSVIRLNDTDHVDGFIQAYRLEERGLSAVEHRAALCLISCSAPLMDPQSNFAWRVSIFCR